MCCKITKPSYPTVMYCNPKNSIILLDKLQWMHYEITTTPIFILQSYTVIQKTVIYCKNE